jgi:Domain of unknown function (DUF4382)
LAAGVPHVTAVHLGGKKIMKPKIYLVVAAVVIIALAGWLASCSSGSGSSARLATVNVSLSDPPTCAAPNGPFTHAFVSISDVRIHQSASASANDSGWVDLTPALNSAPIQVDLLALGGNGCILAQLGANQQIQAGTYQQIRLILAPDSASVAGNQCGSTNNCVVFNGQTTALDLSSESKTGIKIPSGQLAGGNFTVGPGQVKGLVIDFDACASIVVQSNGNFRLKPVLHAGEVGLSSNSITGQLVDSTTLNPISGAQSIVALETKDANGIDRMIMQTTPDATGHFIFCPVPVGTYDVVAVLETGSGASAVAYATTVTSGVQPGDALGEIPMHVQVSPNAQPGLITGLVSTAGASGAISEDVALSALELMTIGGSGVEVTIPLAQQQSTVLSETTVSNASCAANTDCVTYGFALPAALPFLGAFSTSGTSYAQIPGSSVDYTVDAMAFQPGSGSTPTCTPSEMTTSVQPDGTTPLTVSSGLTITAHTLAFTGCQ